MALPALVLVHCGAHAGDCWDLTVDEIQGEGVTWADNNGRFVFTTEGRQAPIALADCPLPP